MRVGLGRRVVLGGANVAVVITVGLRVGTGVIVGAMTVGVEVGNGIGDAGSGVDVDVDIVATVCANAGAAEVATA